MWLLTMTALGATPALEDAHRAWLADDLVGTTTAVRDVLRGSDPAERANALGLLSTAWRERGGWLPADWSLPEGVLDLSVDQIRIERDGGQRFRTVVHGHTSGADVLSDLRLGGEGFALSRATGTWFAQQEGDRWYVELEGPDLGTPMAAGLYDLSLETQGGTTDGWVVLADHVADGAPTLTTPWPGAVVHGAPTFRWDEFLSSAWLEGERRGVGVWVARIDGGAWTEAWSWWSDDPSATEVTGGALAPGTYWASLSYRESRTLGPVRVSRVARTGRRFHVR